VDDLSKRLEEVHHQRLKLRDKVNSKSNELMANAKRWVAEMSALDRVFVGKSLLFFSFPSPFPAFGCRLPAYVGNRRLKPLEHLISPFSGWGQAVFFTGCHQSTF
jgi:hypothetical protein